MIAEDEEALICDFAEMYGVFDFRELPVELAATLASGLGENSRIYRKLNHIKVSENTLLLASAIDRLGLLVWFQSEDGRKGINRPKSIVDSLLQDESENDVEGFETVEEFKRMWIELTEEE